MRENKFRSYSDLDEKFYYFFDGMYFQKIINNEYVETDAYRFSWHNAEQYIGLNDKNSIEIYEADMTNYGIVKFWKGKFQIIQDNGQCYDDLCWCNDKIEVIGNKHQNKNY